MKGIDTIRESFKTRQVKYGGYAALITLAVLVALILVNLLMGQFSFQLDLTESKLFSLSEQTLSVLETVKTPVNFFGIWRSGEESQDVMTVVNLYMSKNRNIRFEAIDPDTNPGFVVRYDKDKKGISRGSLIIEGEKGFRVIGPYDMYDFTQNRQGGSSITGIAVERRITSALLFAGTGNSPVVYETTGHDEIPLASYGLVDMIERENYTLKQVNLVLSEVPDDASAIILNNPRRDLSPGEAEKLLNYLSGGGRLMILADYRILDISNVNDVLASYGLRFDYGIIHEADPRYTNYDPRLEVPDLPDHDITQPLADKTKTPVILLEAMSLSELATKRRTVEIKPLMTTSSDAFLRTDLNENSASKTASDISGPHTLGVAVMDPSWIQGNESQARIIAIGYGGLLGPVAFLGQIPGNIDLFMNSLTWLQDRPETISVRSKSLFMLPLRMNLVQIIIFGGIFILIIPLGFFIAGLVTWLKRRHL